jgi:hypothetical protein
MDTITEQITDTDVEGYSPPTVEVIGSIADLTAGGEGEVTDSCNTGHYS